MDRHQLDIRRLLKSFGLRIEGQRQAGGHIKIVVTDGTRRETVIFPVSPSDARWKKNMESHLRKTFSH